MDLSHAEWRKATYSTGNGGACVEVARDLPGSSRYAIPRTPRNRRRFAPDAWHVFCAGVKGGEFGLS